MITNGAEGWRKINFDIHSYVIMAPTNADPLVYVLDAILEKQQRLICCFTEIITYIPSPRPKGSSDHDRLTVTFSFTPIFHF